MLALLPIAAALLPNAPVIRPAVTASRAATTTMKLELPKLNAAGALSLALAAALVFTPVDEASAARGGRSGGRVGGRAPAPAMRAAPSQSYAAPRTNVYVAPAPMMGYGMGYGGFGYSPFGGMGSGAYLGLTFAEILIREQQRQAYIQQQLETQRALGQDQAQIAALTRQLEEQNSKVEQIRQQPQGQVPQPAQGQAPAAAPAAGQPVDQATMDAMMKQLAEQNLKIRELEAAQAK